MRGGRRRPKAGNPPGPNCIRCPGNQRDFRADDHEVDSQLKGKVTDRLGVKWIDQVGFNHRSDTRIAGCANHTFDLVIIK